MAQAWGPAPSAGLCVICRAMYERLLILQPDQAQASRLGGSRVGLANAAGLLLGILVAIVLILMLTG